MTVSYTDLRDFSCEYALDTGSLYVQLEKLGGGTVGKAYAGTWRYIVSRDGVEITRGQSAQSGTPTTHEDMARYIAGRMEINENVNRRSIRKLGESE